MEIERVNENTVKFYISYVDIEDRGFEKEEIWYNRERSEQLFWQMMDEVNYKEDFSVEGPLWIQVQAMDKGLEIVVTKAKVSKNGEHFEFPKEGKSNIEIPLSDKFESYVESEIIRDNFPDKLNSESDYIWAVLEFKDFEDVIRLSHSFKPSDEGEMETTLVGHKDKYYLYLEMAEHYMEYQDDLLSQVFEFGEDSDKTIHILEEYGKVIFEDNVFEQVKSFFPIN